MERLIRNVHEIILAFVAPELALLKHASALNVKIILCTLLTLWAIQIRLV